MEVITIYGGLTYGGYGGYNKGKFYIITTYMSPVN